MALLSLVKKGYILSPSYSKVKPGAKLIIQAMAAPEELLALKFTQSSPRLSPVFSDCSKFKQTEDDKAT